MQQSLALAPEPGDVFLGQSSGSLAIANLLYQRTFYRKAQSTHAAVCMSGNMFLHSLPGSGVKIEPLFTLVDSFPKWKVIRRRNIKTHHEKMYWSCVYFLQQRYNLGLNFRSSPTAAFCSELIVCVYRRTGIQIFGRRLPNRIFPAHFDRKADERQMWHNVTAGHELQLFTNNTDKKFAAQEFLARSAMMSGTLDRGRQMLELIEQGQVLFPELADRFSEIQADFKKQRKSGSWMDEK